ncbi:MAG: hypothetical protein WC473_03605 [Patescibacteria group bacterium]|jgi:hypothetical protein
MTEPSVERLIKDAHRVLNNPFWIPELEANRVFERIHDDHDGTFTGRLMVQFTKDGDAWIKTDKHHGPSLRYRSPLGGGSSPRVKNALMLLALAIKLDNEQRPQEVIN